ncbi:unnamed protein product [Allacma fusca]|uniref:Armadillo repeat-containing protein 2 n=1 Tax=Allacma fusca TaxID=39272 RepID=A0A8J2NSA4_9HEXA|nr:unnamed protein product [Allacma fusca]
MLKENTQPWIEMSEKKESLERPFYELPVHIKPCSKIIQETRRQLLRKGKSPVRANIENPPCPDEEEDHLVSSLLASTSSLKKGHGFTEPSPSDSVYEDYFDELLSPSSASSSNNATEMSFPSIRPVHTQRPKTGTEHDIWGISSRKRPPSAITLSRLSLDDFEEEFQTGRPSLSRQASEDSGKSIKLREKDVKIPPGASALFPEDNTAHLSSHANVMPKERESYRKTMKQIDEVTRKIKDASITSTDPNTLAVFSSTEDTNWNEGLIPAVNHLHSIVKRAMEERPLKSEVITALQQVKSNMGEIEDCPTEVKHRLLKLIFKLVERNQHDEDVVFWASFVLLHCKISGNNHTTVFKMVFKASRSKEYWAIILETEYLDLFMESISRICPITQTDSMIYGYGTLKFICTDKSVLTRILQLNLVPTMTLHLNLLNYAFGKKKKAIRVTNDCNNKAELPVRHDCTPETIFNGVFQLTSILRSVVGEESSLQSVVSSGLLDELCSSLEWTVDDIDILSNTVRILSVVSSESHCCQCISSNDIFVHTVVSIIHMWHSKEDVVVRLSYCLGNLLANCENLRIRLFEEPSCYNMILYLINFYLEKSSPIFEDILIKAIRILANWSLNPDFGREICDDPQISHILNSILVNKKFSDELLTCVISTLNNTSFYMDYTSTDMHTVETAQHLYEYLTWKNIDGRTEVMKVLGNLTRNMVIREMTADHVNKLLVSLEEEQNNEELLCATVGVLMNIIVEGRASEEFLTHRGIDHLLRLMQVNNDLALNLMICQFLWNIQISSESHHDNTEISPSFKKNHIDSKRGAEIAKMIKKKLETFDQDTLHESEQLDVPCLNLQAQYQTEYQSVAERLLEKLTKKEL